MSEIMARKTGGEWNTPKLGSKAANWFPLKSTFLPMILSLHLHYFWVYRFILLHTFSVQGTAKIIDEVQDRIPKQLCYLNETYRVEFVKLKYDTSRLLFFYIVKL